MDSTAYKIEVLHYLNPHLMWIERKYEAEIILEQIGIFGLLPFTNSIDIESGKVLKKKAEEWMPAVKAVMKDFFKDNNDVYFEAIHIDRRSSIFNDNIHKFGDIFKLQDANSKTYFSTYIMELGYGYQNETEFFQKLSTGNIKTKLNIPETNQVITAIENYMTSHGSSTKRNKAVETNTSMFRAIKHMGQALTAKNLELHNRNQDLGRMGNVSKIIEQKTKDFLLCKVEKEESLGRATSRLRGTYSDVSNSEASATWRKNEYPNSLTNTQANKNMSLDSMTKTHAIETKSKQEIIKSMQRDVDVKEEVFLRRSGFDNSSNVNENSIFVNENEAKVDRDDKNNKNDQTNAGISGNFNYPSKVKQPEFKKGNTNYRSSKPYLIAYGPPMIDRTTYKITPKYELADSLAPMEPEPKITKTSPR